MKIPIKRQHPSWAGMSTEFRELECRGSGTKEDPAIIEPSKQLPNGFTLEESDLFITFQNCYLTALELLSCQNVRLENCNIWKIFISHCFRVVINKSTIRRKLTLRYSNDDKIEDCSIRKLKIVVSNYCFIKNCSIKKITSDWRSINIFEANRFPDYLITWIENKSWFWKKT